MRHSPGPSARGGADLLLYIAGADPYAGDRLGRLSVSRAGLLERDRRVLTAARSAGLPVGIVCGGGYCVDIGAIVEIHAGTMLLAADLLAAEGK
jgi:acetoin utilization deacetylase AcuC-like enzyme